MLSETEEFCDKLSETLIGHNFSLFTRMRQEQKIMKKEKKKAIYFPSVTKESTDKLYDHFGKELVTTIKIKPIEGANELKIEQS